MKGPILSEEFRFTLPGHLCIESSDVERRGHEALFVLKDGKTLCRVRGAKSVVNIAKAHLKVKTERDYLEHRLFDPIIFPTEDTATTAATAAIAEREMTKLAQRARRGDGEALWFFATLVCQCAEGLTQMIRINSDALIPFARKVARWPLMMSPHPQNCDPKEWLQTLQVGQELPIQLHKLSKWKPGTAATLASILHQHLEFVRSQRIGIGVNNVPIKEWLPEFNRKTAAKWWDVGWKFLAATYPKPEEIAEFDQLVTAPSKRKSPGRRRQAIKDAMRNAFIAFASQPKHELHVCDCGSPAAKKVNGEWICSRCLNLGSYPTTHL